MLKKISMVLSISIFLVATLVWQSQRISYAADIGDSTVYLPLISRNYPPPPPVFGAQVSTFTNPQLIQLTVDAQIYWMRLSTLDWSKIEPTEPVNGVHNYDWSSVPETTLQNLVDNDIRPIAIVQMTPDWAQKYPGVYCGPVAAKNLGDFAAFMQAAVQRYSQSPYDIHYWELGNEPDVARSLVPADSGFGCWGEDDDTYYGGGYYAEMLKVAYPAIKAADPQAQVLIGGLLLDCDPNDADCVDPKPSRFLEGILRNGGGDYFDIVSFHGYSFFHNGVIHDDDFPSWDQRGGVVLGKADFLQRLMVQYGVSKPLFHTEGSLLCPEGNPDECDPPGDAFQEAKADYVVWLYTRALAYDFLGSIWYTLDGSGWRNGGLIGDLNDPDPSYYAMDFIAQELANVEYVGQPPVDNENLQAYDFRDSDKTIRVAWSVDGTAHNLTLPAGYTQVYDKLGNPLSVSGTVLSVNSPVYIEFP